MPLELNFKLDGALRIGLTIFLNFILNSYMKYLKMYRPMGFHVFYIYMTHVFIYHTHTLCMCVCVCVICLNQIMSAEIFDIYLW